jgi:hypothetical protein
MCVVQSPVATRAAPRPRAAGPDKSEYRQEMAHVMKNMSALMKSQEDSVETLVAATAAAWHIPTPVSVRDGSYAPLTTVHPLAATSSSKLLPSFAPPPLDTSHPSQKQRARQSPLHSQQLTSPLAVTPSARARAAATVRVMMSPMSNLWSSSFSEPSPASTKRGPVALDTLQMVGRVTPTRRGTSSLSGHSGVATRESSVLSLPLLSESLMKDL